MFCVIIENKPLTLYGYEYKSYKNRINYFCYLYYYLKNFSTF